MPANLSLGGTHGFALVPRRPGHWRADRLLGPQALGQEGPGLARSGRRGSEGCRRPGSTPVLSPMSADTGPVPLTDAQIERIAEKAAAKAVEKMTGQLYQEVGRSVVSKVLY